MTASCETLVGEVLVKTGAHIIRINPGETENAVVGLNDKIKILIVDDHVLVRMGFKTMLVYEPDFLLGSETADRESTVREDTAHKPDVILMNLILPDISGAEATRRRPSNPCPTRARDKRRVREYRLDSSRQPQLT